MPILKMVQKDVNVADVSMDKITAASASHLNEDQSLYFLIDDTTVMIGLHRLVLSRLRRDGVERAVGLMSLAKKGAFPKRSAINIREIDDDLFIVLDGNSTVYVAMAANWSEIACHVTKV